MKRLSSLIMCIIICGTVTSPVYSATDKLFTRASFCDKIIRTLEIEYDVSEIECPFTDLSKNVDYYEAAMMMYEMEYIDGYQTGLFKPRLNMSNAGVAKVLTTMLFGDFSVPDDVVLESNEYPEHTWKAKESGLMTDVDDWDSYAYENSVNYDLIEEMISEIKSSSAAVSLDLSKNSISIENTATVFDLIGAKNYVQGDNVITSLGDCIIRQSNSSSATTNTIRVSSSNADIVIANINIDSTITIESGAVAQLTLVGDNTVIAGKGSPGVIVNDNAVLSISGNGTLTAVGGDGKKPSASSSTTPGYGTPVVGPAIGTDKTETPEDDKIDPGIGDWRDTVEETENPGELIINSGTVIGQGGSYGAGIGFRKKDGVGLGVADGGKIRINGGVITAIGGEYGAGIGGGYFESNGKIEINGGIITATGGEYGAGIGGGNNGDGGQIEINGGTITAIGGEYGAGIGGGNYGDGGTVYIQNTNVTAKGYNGIGGGSSYNSYGCESITILNSELDISHTDLNGSDYQEKIYNTTVDSNDEAALLNNTAIVSTSAYGASNISYQWQVSAGNANWEDVQGQTFAKAKIKMTEENDGYYYRCKLTNGWGNVLYTDSTRCFTLKFVLQPVDAYAEIGDYIFLETEVRCSNVTYQWEKSYDNGMSYKKIDGENFNTLVLDATANDNGVLYRCVITANNGDSIASESAKVTVNTKDYIYYIERYYLQSADKSSYYIYEQNTIDSYAGTVVTASSKTFDGFTENHSLGTHDGSVVSGDILVLSRYYDRDTYNISFDTNGGVALAPLAAKYEESITMPEPIYPGYSFAGWYTDVDLTDKCRITQMPLGGMTVYAKWISLDSISGVEYKINDIVIYDSLAGDRLTNIPLTHFVAEISVTNVSSTDTDKIVVATYNSDGILKELNYLYADLNIGKTVDYKYFADNIDGEIKKIKIFIWSETNNLTPLAESIEFTNN